MKLLGFTICLCVLVVQECVCDYYPPVFWQWQNCVFRQLKETYDTNKTLEYFMKVLPYNGVNIVCPNNFAVNDWLGYQFPDHNYENMWMVDKHGYDNCMVNDKGDPKINKRILVCDNPFKLKYKLFRFHHKYNTEEPMFAPGHHYYFISTSDGFEEDMNKRSGGHCKDAHMKLHIYVCDPKKEDCVWEMPRCDPPYEMMKKMRQYTRNLPPPTLPPITVPKPTTLVQTKELTSTTPTAKPTTYKAVSSKFTFEMLLKTSPAATAQPQKECSDEKESGTSVHMVLNFVLGGVIFFMAVVIVILACGLARRSTASFGGRPASVAFSAFSEPSAHLYEETGRFVHPLTPLSKSPPQTPITLNPPFHLAPMSEIRARSASNKFGFNNSVYNKRRHSHDGTPTQPEASPMLSENDNGPAPV